MEQLININSTKANGGFIIKPKSFSFRSKLRLFLFIYVIWFVVSFFIVKNHPNNYASNFTDLPKQVQFIPAIVLSLIYLVLFIPAFVLVIIYLFWFIVSIIFPKTNDHSRTTN